MKARPFAGMVEACAERDISRAVAFELKRQGFIETFTIGRRRYVFLDSLDTLGQRLLESKEANERLNREKLT